MASNRSDAPTTQDNIWQYKPWWCQPWSIVLTTVVVVGGSWLLGHRYWITAIVALPMVTWMGFFLLQFPRLAVESGLLAELQQQAQPQGTGDQGAKDQGTKDQS